MNKTEIKKLTTILMTLTMLLMIIPIMTVSARAIDTWDIMDSLGETYVPESTRLDLSSTSTSSPTQTPILSSNVFRNLVLVVIVVGVILAVVVVCVLLLHKRKTV
jgi:NADH:ubiquinone oxidoreductase subunit 6 (subunit J)